MPFPPNYKPPHQFSSTNQPKKNGRKPALYKQLTKMMGVHKISIDLSKEDFSRLQQWILERNKIELERIAKDPNTPIFLVNMVTAIVQDIKGGSYGTIERTYERIFGKPKITADIESGGKPLNQHTHQLDLSNLADEDLAVLGKIIMKETTPDDLGKQDK